MMKQRLPGRRDVVLVAHEPANCEHLGIRLVAAGLAEVGFRPRVLPVGSPASVGATVSETLAMQPSLVGAAAEPARIVLPDGPVTTPVDTRPVEAQPLPHESCAADGGQSESLDASCEVNTLTNAVSRAAGWPCYAYASPAPAGFAYAVVIDCDGRAIELLSLPDQTPWLSGAERQAWLDSLANDRWPCYAGQSVQFTCMVCLFP